MRRAGIHDIAYAAQLLCKGHERRASALVRVSAALQLGKEPLDIACRLLSDTAELARDRVELLLALSVRLSPLRFFLKCRR